MTERSRSKNRSTRKNTNTNENEINDSDGNNEIVSDSEIITHNINHDGHISDSRDSASQTRDNRKNAFLEDEDKYENTDKII
mgnify:CR=1 FL=1